jgi:ABC-type sugar transport system ATPase subunit
VETDNDAGINVSDVSRVFGTVVALQEVNLRVPRHGRVGIVGPSGCGKSSLLSLICGLDDATTGTLSVLGKSLAAQRLASCAWMPRGT